jgi:hypothetical protein
MSSAITKRIADICDLSRLNTELVVMARGRGRREAEQINEYLRTPEFQRRAEALEPTVRAELAQGRPVLLPEIADALGIPADIAFACWLSQFGATIRDVVMERK